MIYVMSDIHGEKKKFDSVMEKINLTSDDKLYILGDVIDRGNDSIQILLELMKMKNVTVLLGNHELMMLNAITPPDNFRAIKLWYHNYGSVTHNTFLELTPEIQTKIKNFISQMPLSIEITVNDKKYILVHGAPIELQYRMYTKFVPEREYVTWERLNPDDIMPKGKTVIFGHTPTDDYQKCVPLSIWYGKDKIGIDCGCGHSYEGCRLACLRLDDMQEFYSS